MLDFITHTDLIEKSKHRDKIWREQINLVAENAMLSNAFSLLLALILAWMLWPVTSHGLIAFWLIGMAMVAGLRIVLTLKQRRNRDNDKLNKISTGIFLASIMLTAAGWGFAAYFLFPLQPPELELLMGIMLAGIVAGGVPVMSPVIRLYYAYAGVILLPLALKLVMIGSHYYVTGCRLEAALAGASVGERCQFERVGYFVVDPDSAPGRPVFNRIVTLKDAWAKIEKKQG